MNTVPANKSLEDLSGKLGKVLPVYTQIDQESRQKD